MALRDPRTPHFLQSVAPPQQVETFTFSRTGIRRDPRPGARGAGGDSSPPPEVEQVRREAMERVADAVHSLRLEAERLAEQARADAIEVGFQVASRILESEIKANPETLFALVRSALRKAGDSRRIALRVCPDGAALLEASRDAQGNTAFSSARVEIVPDPSLAPGDCVVETDFGQVDGRLATRISEARRAVRAAVEGGAA
jgi:flagellar assembly protein FliH